MPAQLVLPLDSAPALGRSDFVVAAGNAQAVAFIDAWPNWPVPAAGLFGPAGSGKSHLAEIWRMASAARVVDAVDLAGLSTAAPPIVVENIDSQPPCEARDRRIFRLLETATTVAPVVLTGFEPPSAWPTIVPDLASRYRALLALPLWQPDDDLLAALARKLLDDRQLSVPGAVIEKIVHSLERTPGAIREFIARADAKALSEGRPISLALVREMVAAENQGLS